MGKGALIGKVVGVEKIIDEIKLEEELIRHRVQAEVEDLAIELTGLAQDLAPYRTGELRGSIRWSGAATEKGVYAQVGSDEPLSRWMEFGWTPNPHRGKKERRDKKTGKLLEQGWLKGRGGKFRANASEWTRNPKTSQEWARYAATRGTPVRHSRPFLRPALGLMRDTIRERLRDAIEGV